MRALELHRLSGMGESLGDRTLRVAERVTFWLVGGEKLVFWLVEANLEAGHIVLLGW